MKLRLDDAIDRVAARITSVEEDDALAARIASSLPERSQWSLHWLMPRLAIAAALAIGMTLVVLQTFDEGSPTVLRSENTGSRIVEPRSIVEPPSNDRRTSVERPLRVRRTTVEPSSNDPRTEGDHEYSLAAIAAPEALGVGSLARDALPADDGLAIAPLVIADLPLTADFSPR